jgi:hypothetical protein
MPQPSLISTAAAQAPAIDQLTPNPASSVITTAMTARVPAMR